MCMAKFYSNALQLFEIPRFEFAINVNCYMMIDKERKENIKFG